MEEIRTARKVNQNKKIDKRLEVLEMHGEGKRQKEIQEITGFCRSYINRIVLPITGDFLVASLAVRHLDRLPDGTGVAVPD